MLAAAFRHVRYCMIFVVRHLGCKEIADMYVRPLTSSAFGFWVSVMTERTFKLHGTAFGSSHFILPEEKGAIQN